MKFEVDDEVMHLDTRLRGTIINVHYMYEFIGGASKDKTRYYIRWDNRTASWEPEDKIKSTLGIDIPLDLMLVNILIDNSLDNRNEDDFLHYVRLKKELIAGEQNDGTKEETGQ